MLLPVSNMSPCSCVFSCVGRWESFRTGFISSGWPRFQRRLKTCDAIHTELTHRMPYLRALADLTFDKTSKLLFGSLPVSCHLCPDLLGPGFLTWLRTLGATYAETVLWFLPVCCCLALNFLTRNFLGRGRYVHVLIFFSSPPFGTARRLHKPTASARNEPDHTSVWKISREGFFKFLKRYW